MFCMKTFINKQTLSLYPFLLNRKTSQSNMRGPLSFLTAEQQNRTHPFSEIIMEEIKLIT